MGGVRALLPDADLSAVQLPEVNHLGLPPPRMKPPNALAELCLAEEADRAGHAHGNAFRDVVRNLAGDLRNVLDLVVRPASEQDVVTYSTGAPGQVLR